MAATVGALRVILGADTAAFDKGIKGAETRLSGFSRTAAVAGGAIAAALGTVAVAGAIRFAGSIRHAIDEADKMSKLARSVGVPIETLSELRWAADLADISIDELGGGIVKLSKAMVEAARNGTGTQAQAFRALGVSVKDATGNIRPAEDVLLDIADAFQSFQDGAGKTAVASELFGRSAGVKMVNLLNQGSAAIREQAKEARDLNLVYSQEMGDAAERFNDNLNRLSQTATGAAIVVGAALLPALNDTVDIFLELRDGAATAAPGIFDAAGKAAVSATLNVIPFVAQLRLIKAAYDYFKGEKNTGLPELPTFDEFQKQFGTDEASQARKAAADALAAALAGQAQATKDAAAAEADLNARMAEGKSVYEATRTPLEAYNDELTRLGVLLNKRAIDAETFGRAQTMAAASAVQPWLGVASTVGGALGQLFEENKGVAIAQAVINTAQGATAALAQYPPPLSFAAAAAQVAAGAIQIANIRRARPGTSSRPTVGGGSGRSIAAQSTSSFQPEQPNAPRGAAAVGIGKSVNITVQGDFFNREHFLRTIEGIQEALDDGARLSVRVA